MPGPIIDPPLRMSRCADETRESRVHTRQIETTKAVGHGPPTGPTLAASLRARLAAARGQTREALSIIERAGWIQAARAMPLDAYDRLLRAQLLEQLGRDDEALEFYAQFGERSPYDLPFLWQVELGMARIAERRGDRAGAARWYRSVATRLRDADLPLKSQAGRATTLADALR